MTCFGAGSCHLSSFDESVEFWIAQKSERKYLSVRSVKLYTCLPPCIPHLLHNIAEFFCETRLVKPPNNLRQLTRYEYGAIATSLCPSNEELQERVRVGAPHLYAAKTEPCSDAAMIRSDVAMKRSGVATLFDEATSPRRRQQPHDRLSQKQRPLAMECICWLDGE